MPSATSRGGTTQPIIDRATECLVRHRHRGNPGQPKCGRIFVQLAEAREEPCGRLGQVRRIAQMERQTRSRQWRAEGEQRFVILYFGCLKPYRQCRRIV